MTTILEETDVTVERLAAHLDDAGFSFDLTSNRLSLYSRNGLNFYVLLDTERKFLIFGTYLPIQKSCAEALMITNDLNDQLYMAKYSLDTDNDLHITYAMTYEGGLMLGQFSRILKRYASLLDHVVGKFDGENKIFALEKVPVEELPAPKTLQ